MQLFFIDMKKNIHVYGNNFNFCIIDYSGCSKNIAQHERISDLRTCNSDDDCIIVNDTSCCGCENVINKKYHDWWNVREVNSCPGRTCEICPPEPIGSKCENRKCELIYMDNVVTSVYKLKMQAGALSKTVSIR